jgi:eukaryotic-like serine/threonine-protein kinase
MDFGRLPEGGAYLVVQLVSGLSLRQRIEAGPIAWREACTIGAQIADALVAIHARGFVHRDLTADNILLTSKEDGSPYVHVLDLGVAGVVQQEGEPRLTEEGHVVGTAGYMSPEQALGQPTDPRADLYALGVLLWEMCTGRSLWGTRELTQIVASQLTEEPPAIPQLSSAMAPPELALLIHRLLARAPAERPSDAVAVRDTLRRFAALSTVAPVLDRFGVPAALVGVGGAVSAVALVSLVFGAIALFGGGEHDELTKGASARTSVASSAPASAALPSSGGALSPELSPLFEQLVGGRYRAQRRSAAEQLLASVDAPAWARAAADLELTSTCVGRREALARLRQLAVPATLPVIARLRDAPRTGCGRRRQGDCYACVRQDLDEAYRAVRAATPEG